MDTTETAIWTTCDGCDRPITEDEYDNGEYRSHPEAGDYCKVCVAEDEAETNRLVRSMARRSYTPIGEWDTPDRDPQDRMARAQLAS